MPTGVGLSLLENARAAAMEAALEARGALGEGRPNLAVVFASPHFTPRADEVLDAVREAAGPERVIGCIGEAIVSGAREIEGAPAVSVWLGRLPGSIRSFHATYDDGVFSGWPEDPTPGVVLICDPYTFPADGLLHHLNESAPGTPIIGGFASGGMGPGENRLFLDDAVVESGAVGVALGGDLEILPLVSQGCRPIGQLFTITKADRNVIYEIGGRPPMERVRELYEDLSEDDRGLLSKGLLIGRAVDEYQTDFSPGDFVVRGVVGADPASGALAIGDVPAVGETIQFHVRDAHSADEDLVRILEEARAGLGQREPVGALLFTCNGRGARMFAEPDHDARTISKVLGDLPLAGFFAAGELGPVGNRNFVHGFTASLALFVDSGRAEPTSGASLD